MKFIVCSDLHLRSDLPRCRVQSQEEWIETQRFQLQFIAKTAKEKNIPIFMTGDIFDAPTVPDYIKNMFIEAFYQTNVFGIAGNHELPWHQWDKVDQSSFGVLWRSGIIKPIPILQARHAHYGQEVIGEGDMLFLHTLIFEDKKSMPPNTKAMTAKEALDKYPDAKFIFAGDNHHGFGYINEGKNNHRYVVVPGCLNRQASDFKDYEPRIYLIDTDIESIKPIPVPDVCEIVTDAYVQESKDKMDRIHSFASLIKEKMQQGKGSGIDFKENVKKGMENNPELTEGVITFINQMMEK
jgi:hypothetical protein